MKERNTRKKEEGSAWRKLGMNRDEAREGKIVIKEINAGEGKMIMEGY